MADAPDQATDAASVLLLREADTRLEVFVVERRKAGAFAGVLAFPGGKVDPADRVLPPARFAGIEVPQETARWGLDPDEPSDRARVLGWYVAAVRELFEEVGVLLASRPTSSGRRAVTADDLAEAPFAEARSRLVRRGEPWDWTGFLQEQELELELGALRPWSRWVTPHGEPRRFDTVFLTAVLPSSQARAVVHDDVEVVASRWCTPAQILAERDAGESVVIYPTRRQLLGLPAAATGLDVVLAARDLRAVQPTIGSHPDGTIVATHPWDGTVEPVF